MLQALRNKLHGWPAIVVLGICVFAVAFFGIEGYFSAQVDTYVAKVGSQEISQQQFQDRLNQLRQQASGSPQGDASIYEKPEMKKRVLDAMIDQQLLLQANEALGMRVSDIAVRDYIASIPAFQVGGHFDTGTYRALLAGQGQTPMMFEGQVRASLAMQLLPDAISSSTLVTTADLDRYLALRLQRRDLRYFSLPRPMPADSAVDQAQLAAYYKEHQADFMSPEQVSVQYLEVKAGDLKPVAAPAEDELKKRYEDEKQRFVKPEQRLVSHILIGVPKNATPEQQKAALAKAEKLAAEATPANFAQLAKQYSEDLGSKSQGGDLGWLERGVANPAFDEALFALQKGQISKPVLSPDEGYHVIWARDVRSGDIKSYDEVRAQLLDEANKTARDRQYNDIAGQLADKTYQNPASLEPAAQALGLKIQSTPLFSRNGGQGIAADPKVLKAAFADDVLVQGNNSSLIQLGNDTAVVIHLAKHVVSAPRPLAAVSEAIKQKILDQRIDTQAKQQADALLARLRKGEKIEAVAASVSAKLQSVQDVVRVQPELPPQIRDQAFVMPHPTAGQPQYADVSTGQGMYALIALDKVQDGDLSKVTAQQRDALRGEMSRVYGDTSTQGLIDILRAKTEIKIAADR
ncbi:MAG: SurA N-terminal domain-containing protein, partial [Dyella sp.]